MNYKLVTVFVIFLILVTTVLCQFETRYRLPKTTYPIDYNIWLNVSMESDAFNGEVEIQIGVASPTNEILLRQYDITFNNIELFEIDGINKIKVPITKATQVIEYTLPLTSEVTLQIGKVYSLKLTYTSKSVSSVRGMFRSFNTNPITAAVTPLIATNFLPQYASSVFPCYDDPEFKANFILSIQHPVGYRAVSNMEILSSVPDEAPVTTTFHKTPLLAAHSIAFAILNYQSVCDNSGVIKICVYHDDQHTVDDVQLVLRTAMDALTELETYFGVGLGLAKLDIIPIDSSAPMIGNYGLLINKQRAYYYDEKTSSIVQKDRIVRHTIRQIVDLYFSNVVTLEWWDDLWINDGISLILEHTIANILYPEMEAINEFINSLYEYATQRVFYYGPGLLSLSTIESLLDIKTQNRNAAFMHMFKNIVGLDKFKAGLKGILSGVSKSFNSETFLTAFESNAEHINIMNTWLKQDSYPILNVERNYETNVATLSQDDVLNVYDNYAVRTHLFLLPVNSIKEYDAVRVWDATSISELLDIPKIISFTKEELDNTQWIIYNPELSGFYHTNYDVHNWDLLGKQLDKNFTEIPWITRTQLLHDSMLFALNGHLSLDVMFKIANYTSKENEFAPLTRFITGFNQLDAIIFGTNIYTNFTKFAAHKIKHLYSRVKIIDLNENHDLSITDHKLRKSVIEMACHMGLKQCKVDTNLLLKQLVGQAGGLEILLQHECGDTILYNGMAMADSDLFWKVFVMRDTLDPNDFAEALGHIQDPGVIDELLAILITQNGEIINGVEINLNVNERLDIFKRLINFNIAALDKTLTFAIDSSDLIKQRWFSSNKYSISNNFLGMINTDERLQQFLEIDTIYQGGRATQATENVELVSQKILQFDTILAGLVQYIDEEIDEEIDDNVDNSDDNLAVSVTGSTILLAFMIIIVNL